MRNITKILQKKHLFATGSTDHGSHSERKAIKIMTSKLTIKLYLKFMSDRQSVYKVTSTYQSQKKTRFLNKFQDFRNIFNRTP